MHQLDASMPKEFLGVVSIQKEEWWKWVPKASTSSSDDNDENYNFPLLFSL
jgi:hypothetical protein